MTNDPKTPPSDPVPAPGGQVSMLAPPDLGIRVRPAEYARMVGVSRQCVSTWIKEGKVTLGIDGLLEPRAATRQLLRNIDPRRLRAKLLRPLVDDVATLRDEIARRDARIAELEAEVDYLGRGRDEEACTAEAWPAAIIARWPELQALDGEDLAAALRRLEDELLESCATDIEAGRWPPHEGAEAAQETTADPGAEDLAAELAAIDEDLAAALEADPELAAALAEAPDHPEVTP